MSKRLNLLILSVLQHGVMLKQTYLFGLQNLQIDRRMKLGDKEFVLYYQVKKN